MEHLFCFMDEDRMARKDGFFVTNKKMFIRDMFILRQMQKFLASWRVVLD